MSLNFNKSQQGQFHRDIKGEKSEDSSLFDRDLKKEKSGRFEHIKIDKEFAEIERYISQNKDKIKNPENALLMIQAIGKLESVSPQLKRESLQQDVHILTGLCIHAADNYPTTEDFTRNVENVGSIIKKLFKESATDIEKLKFINNALSSRGCFEARVENIIDFDTLYGKIRYEIEDLMTKLNKNSFTLEEVIKHLESINFFEKNGLNKELFKTGEIIKKLETMGLIQSEIQSMPTRINDALASYQGFGTGMANFKSYLQRTLKLSEEENAKLDESIEGYFKIFPGNRKWI